LGGSVFLDPGGGALSSRPFAEQTQAAIDDEVSRLLGEAEQRAVRVLTDHREVLDRVVDELLANETIDGSDVYALAGRMEPAGGTGITVAPDRAPSSPHEREGAPTSSRSEPITGQAAPSAEPPDQDDLLGIRRGAEPGS
jgi:cell division protease FtsH